MVMSRPTLFHWMLMQSCVQVLFSMVGE